MFWGTTALAFHLRSGAFHGEITWDEADYAFAAMQGFWANWSRAPGLHELRHYHGPLSIYLITLSISLFGPSEAAIRLPGVLISSIVCGAGVLATYDLTPGRARRRIVVAALAGILLATAPASVEMAATAKPHPLVELSLVLNVWLLSRYLRDPSPSGATWFGLSLGIQFVAMEYGPVVVGLAILSTLLAVGWPPPNLARDSRRALFACLGLVLIVWPPGLVHRDILRNFMYYVRYAARGQMKVFRGQALQQLPWWAYLWWYWDRFPMLLGAMFGSMLLVGIWMGRQRQPIPIAIGVFLFGLLLVIHRAHIMSLAYSCFVVPALAIGGTLAGNWAWDRGVPCARPTGISGPAWRCGLVVLAGAAIAGGVTRPLAPRAMEGPLTRMTLRLATLAEPAACVAATEAPVVRYLLRVKSGRSDISVIALQPTGTTKDLLSLQSPSGSRPRWALVGDWIADRYPHDPFVTALGAGGKLTAKDDGVGLYWLPPVEAKSSGLR